MPETKYVETFISSSLIQRENSELQLLDHIQLQRTGETKQITTG